MTDFLHPWPPPSTRGSLQKSFAKHRIINAVGGSQDAIAHVVVQFFVRNHEAPRFSEV